MNCSGKVKLRFKLLVATVIGVLGITDQAAAFEFDTHPDWKVRWDNNVLYNLGFRAQNIKDSIGNNPAFSEGDYKFPDRGDVVTNRISNLSEFDAVYQNKYGFRVSASIWKDFAYDDKVENNPGLPNALWGSTTNGRYSNYTERYYRQGGEFLDAFVFANFDVAGKPASIRVGRLTQFWGNALFFGGLGINYGQNPSDGIKGLTAPGSKAKELAIPRAQVLFQSQVSDTVSMAAQVFGEFRPNRAPEGGTFLNIVGFGLIGPDRVNVGFPGAFVPRGNDVKPSAGDDWGVRLAWSPEWMDAGTIGFYYRKLSETAFWLLFTPTFSDYHLTYADDVTLYGISVDKTIGQVSTGFELSYRKNTALNSLGVAAGPKANEGARGNTLQFIANGLYSLTPNALWDTGSLLVELAYQRKMSTTSNQSLETAENTAACPGDEREACNTKQSLGVAIFFNPQWLNVASGINLDMPIFLLHQIKGTTATRGGSQKEGNTIYSVGLHALVNAKYDITLAYNGYHGRTNGRTAVANPALSPYSANDLGGADGLHFFNDRGWVSLTLGTTF